MALLSGKAPVPGAEAALLRVSEGRDQTGHSLAYSIPGAVNAQTPISAVL
jgi:hypothetical protein